MTHVSWWGLNWAFMHPGGEADAAGFVTVEIGTDQTAVAEQAFCILRALQAAAKARAILVGFFRHERWQQACRDADQLAVALLRMKPPETPEGTSPRRVSPENQSLAWEAPARPPPQTRGHGPAQEQSTFPSTDTMTCLTIAFIFRFEAQPAIPSATKRDLGTSRR